VTVEFIANDDSGRRLDEKDIRDVVRHMPDIPDTAQSRLRAALESQQCPMFMYGPSGARLRTTQGYIRCSLREDHDGDCTPDRSFWRNPNKS
jgi:hypothetical protein